MKQKENKPKIHICSWSGGKDSMATILLALEQVEREMDIKEWEEQQPTLFDFI